MQLYDYYAEGEFDPSHMVITDGMLYGELSEADAAQIDVNTTFALSFPERRPFFQEGADLFQGPLLTVIEAVVEVEDLSLSLGEVLLEHVLEIVSAGDGLYVFFDVTCFSP